MDTTQPQPADLSPAADHPLVSAAWLAEHLNQPHLVILDASVPPREPGALRIPGARRFDLEGAFSDSTTGLPHSMVSAEVFEEQARHLGVHDDSIVVVYDTQELFSAARAWWMFVAMGHDRVAVLDGGLAGWRAAGLPMDEAVPPAAAARQGDFVARPRPGLIVDADVVAEALAGGEVAVVDARSAERFTGSAPEPREGLRGGHMPGATNLPYVDVQTDGHLLPLQELAGRVHNALGGRDRVIFSCGSGVTACVDALAARLAGVRDIAVYDGSWTEWGAQDSGRPVVTGTD